MSFSPAWRVLTWIGVSWYFSLHPHIALFKMESHFWFGQQMPCLRGKTHGLGQCDVDKDPPTNLISWYLWRSSEEQERWIKPLHIKITFYSNSLVVQWLRSGIVTIAAQDAVVVWILSLARELPQATCPRHSQKKKKNYIAYLQTHKHSPHHHQKKRL